MKKINFKHLLYFSVSVFSFSACQEIEGDFENVVQEITVPNNSTEYQEKLVELSVFMGEVLKDPAAREELFDFAKIEGNEDDIEYSLKNLFEAEVNPFSRKKSAIVEAFRKNGENHRNLNEDFNPDELVEFIKENDIGVLAPYLYQNFNPLELTELTVSWWTQEMEDEGYAKDPNYLGEAPGYVFSIDEVENFISFRKNKKSALRTIEEVMANDEYAKIHPTVVFGAFDNFHDQDPESNDEEKRIALTSGVPINLGIQCDDVLPTDVLRYHMPQFRLAHQNTRGFPNPNRISIWVAYGDYSSTGGVPTPNVQVNLILNDQKIDRGDFNWQQERWPVLMTSWPESRQSVQIIVAHRKENRNVTQTTSSVTINPTTGVTQVTSGATVSRSDYKLFFSQTWYRCNEINGAHTIVVPPLNTLRLGNAIWEYSSPYGTCQFTLEPRLTRF